MTDAVTLDTYTFAVLLISCTVLGILIGIVGAPFMADRRKPR